MNTPNNRYLSIASILPILLLCFTFGCSPPPSKEVAEEEKPKSILGQTTQEIGEWDPNGGQEIRGAEEVNMVNRVRVGAGSALHDSAKLIVKRSVDLFWGFEGRYPESHEEFMKKVIIANNVKLPMPMTSCEYQYDVENHELVIVEKKKE